MSARTLVTHDKSASAEPSTSLLTEPLSETIMRDVNSVGRKLAYVLSPSAREGTGGILRQWDLWGLLAISLMFALLVCPAISVCRTLWAEAQSSQRHSVFPLAFTLPWIGPTIISLNCSLLGASNISIFQSLGVLGYCFFPLLIAADVSFLLPQWLSVVKVLLVIIAAVISFGASQGYVVSQIAENRKWLGLYPLILFLTFTSWLIFVVSRK